MSVTVYSTPTCVQCTATYRALEQNGIAYNVVNLLEDEAAYAKVTGMGYRNAPVVMVGEDHWSGFRPDKISALKKAA